MMMTMINILQMADYHIGHVLGRIYFYATQFQGAGFHDTPQQDNKTSERGCRIYDIV